MDTTNKIGWKAQVTPFEQRLVSPTQVCEIIGVSRTTLWRLCRDDPTFPQPIQISPNRKGFVLAEINAWIQKRIEARAQ